MEYSMTNYYTIEDSSRRITQYIKQEAYQWLLKKLSAGEYDYNKCREGEDLAFDMTSRHRITDDEYDQFLSYFETNPYIYVMGNKKARRSNKITTKHIKNYFIQYNDAVLPIGFIIDFFEDDYEFGEDKELIKEFLKAAKEKMKDECRYGMHKRTNQAEAIKECYPCIFKTHLKLILTNAFRALLPIYMIILFTTFFREIHFVEVFKYFANVCQYNMDDPIFITQTLSAYIWNPSNYLIPGFNFMEYLQTYIILILINIIFFFVILRYTIRAIALIYYFVRNIIIRIKFAKYIANANYFEESGVEEIVDVIADENNMNTIVESGEIEDEILASIPKNAHQYNAILKCDIYDTESVYGTDEESTLIMCGRLETHILKLIGDNNKKTGFKKYNLYYDETSRSLAANKKKCGKGIVSIIIFTFLMTVLNNPGLYIWAVDLLSRTPFFEDLDIFY